MSRRLDDPDVVREDYASESHLLARRSIYEGSEGPDTREVVWTRIVEVRPRRVLEVGPGPGELSERLARDLGADVVAVDISPRMVELTRARRIDAVVGDIQALPFDDTSFDVVVAAWVLFHAEDIRRAISEIHRVLRPGGRLVAATNSERHLHEMWRLVDVDRMPSSFSVENGRELLSESFDRVDVDEIDGTVTFPDTDAVRTYVANSVTRRHLAAAVPDISGPLRATRRNAVFVAEKAA